MYGSPTSAQNPREVQVMNNESGGVDIGTMGMGRPDSENKEEVIRQPPERSPAIQM